MPRTPRNPLEADARVSRAPRPRQQRQPRQRQLPPPPPPPPTTKHWSEGTKQTLDFGPPVQFEDDWRPAPPVPAQPLLTYSAPAQNGFGGQTTPAGYTALLQQPYKQVQGSHNPFAALPQQPYYQGQFTQVPFAAPMQPQNTGVYQTQATSAAPTQQQQYPQRQANQSPFSGPPYLGQAYQSPYAALSQQQQQQQQPGYYPTQSPFAAPMQQVIPQAQYSPGVYAAPSQEQQQQQQTSLPPQEVYAAPLQQQQQQTFSPPPETIPLEPAASSSQPLPSTAMFDIESQPEILSCSKLSVLVDSAYGSSEFQPSTKFTLDTDAISEGSMLGGCAWDQATSSWKWIGSALLD